MGCMSEMWIDRRTATMQEQAETFGMGYGDNLPESPVDDRPIDTVQDEYYHVYAVNDFGIALYDEIHDDQKAARRSFAMHARAFLGDRNDCDLPDGTVEVCLYAPFGEMLLSTAA